MSYLEHPTLKPIGHRWRRPKILYIEMQGFKCVMWEFDSQQEETTYWLIVNIIVTQVS